MCLIDESSDGRRRSISNIVVHHVRMMCTMPPGCHVRGFCVSLPVYAYVISRHERKTVPKQLLPLRCLQVSHIVACH
jgi:hypothetical protein